MSDDGADFQQQKQLEEHQQWLADNLEKFQKIFGKVEKNEHERDTKQTKST